MKRQQEELYENLQKKADEICAKGRQLRGTETIDEDVAGDVREMGAEGNDEKCDITTDEQTTSTLEVKKIN